MFRNSLAETLTETEKAFQLSFVAMTEAILLAIQAVSFVVIVIIMAVMANTMAMTARERGVRVRDAEGARLLRRLRRAADLRRIDRHRARWAGSSGIALTFPLADAFAERMGTLFPIFFVSEETMLLQVGAALAVGVVAAAIPAWRTARCGSSTACGRSDERDGRMPRLAGGSRQRCRDGAFGAGCAAIDMTIPFSYIVRNVAARRLTTALTAGGMALVVYVFATVLMLAAGLERTLVATGQDDNVVVIRRAAQTEVQSGVDRRQAGIVESLPDIAIGRDGQKLVSKEPVVLINLPKRDSSKPSNVVIRGVTPIGLALRPQVKLVEGRMFRPGTAEIIAGRSIADGFQGAGVGETLRFASRDWTVVGVFDAGRTGFDSEIWGDAEQMLQAFRRLALFGADLQARRHRAASTRSSRRSSPIRG